MGTTTAPERKWLASDRYRRILHPRSTTQILLLLIWISPIKVRDIFTFHLIMSLCQTGMSVPGTGLPLAQRMPKGRAFIDMVSPWQKKLWVDLAPATLTSISTMALYGYCLPRPWCPGCDIRTRLPSTLSASTSGSLSMAAFTHARSSAEGSCARAQVGMRESNTIR